MHNGFGHHIWIFALSLAKQFKPNIYDMFLYLKIISLLSKGNRQGSALRSILTCDCWGG